MRKGMAQGLARPAYYDRNQVERNASYAASGVAPHGKTTRWTYTVPAGRKAFIEVMNATFFRLTAAGAASIVAAEIEEIPNGGVTADIAIPATIDNTIGVQQRVQASSQFAMSAGAQLIGSTVDASTTGSINYNLAFHGNEYDA